MPELVTTLVSTFRGQRDVAIGNLIGSSAYNLAFINRELNYAAAIAFLLGLIIAVVSYVVQLGDQRRERRERKGLS